LWCRDCFTATHGNVAFIGPVLGVILTVVWVIAHVASWLMLARTRRVGVAVTAGLLAIATSLIAVTARLLHSRAQEELELAYAPLTAILIALA
jgi:hypothetical protein